MNNTHENSTSHWHGNSQHNTTTDKPVVHVVHVRVHNAVQSYDYLIAESDCNLFNTLMAYAFWQIKSANMPIRLLLGLLSVVSSG